jgi:hypothetical protein
MPRRRMRRTSVSFDPPCSVATSRGLTLRMWAATGQRSPAESSTACGTDRGSHRSSARRESARRTRSDCWREHRRPTRSRPHRACARAVPRSASDPRAARPGARRSCRTRPSCAALRHVGARSARSRRRPDADAGRRRTIRSSPRPAPRRRRPRPQRVHRVLFRIAEHELAGPHERLPGRDHMRAAGSVGAIRRRVM